MIEIRTFDNLNLQSGSRVFYRVDYNVPLEGTRITDATRIEETLPTLRRLRERGAAIVIASHLGRPKRERKEKYSLKPVRERLSELLGVDVQWADDCIGAEAEQKAGALAPGDVLLLCCDGLSNLVEDAEMLQAVGGSALDEAPARLIALANDRGGDDNITVVVIRVDESTTPAPAA